MRIFSKGTIREFWEHHPDSRASLEFWYKEVSKSKFENPNEILAHFKKADAPGNGRIVFNIARNKYRLIAKFVYKIQYVYVRFIGTHKEYDKINDIKNI